MRFTEDKFDEEMVASNGIDSKAKILEVDGRRVKLNIWDTAGQERMGFLTSSYYRGAHGIIIVFDITNDESYRNVSNWLGEIERYAFDSALKILVGNKCDLSEQSRAVSTETAREYANNDLSIEYLETSAKEGTNVSEALLKLTELMKKKKDGTVESKTTRGTTLQLNPVPKQEKKKGFCNI